MTAAAPIPECLHDASPEAAIAAITVHVGPILLDLDETLYLRNSTEDFIDSARPRVAALLMLRLMDALKPWRWTGGDATRDVWRVNVVSICLPWTMRLWKRRVHGLATRFTNRRLLAALERRTETPIVATIGFQSIVAPLVAALGMPRTQIIAARMSSFEDRRKGKLLLVSGRLDSAVIGRALFLTDSLQDLPLLDACSRPLRTVWPEAGFRAAFRDVYIPGQYLSRVKRPGARYIVRGILQEDFALWTLASIALAAMPLVHLAGLLFLLLSFWTIYERGYVDNDLIASRFESDPKLSATFADAPAATPRWQPWLWAAGSGAVAIFLLRWPTGPVALDFLAWGVVLLATHGWFMLYNRFDKSTRIWLFAGLQLARSASFVALVPIGLIGAAALGAHVLARWVPYYVYRLGGKDWPDAPFHLTRLLFFLLLSLLIAMATGFGPVLNGTALMLLAWNLFRARQELASVFKSASRLDHQARRRGP